MASFFDWIGPAIQGIGAVAGYLDKPEPFEDIPALQQISRNQELAQQYLESGLDPSSPQFKQLAALHSRREKDAGRDAILKYFDEQYRRQARGAGGFISDRGDENRARALSRAFQEADVRGGLQAQTALQNAATSISGLSAGYQPLVTAFQSKADQDRIAKAGIFEALGELPWGNLGKKASAVSPNYMSVPQTRSPYLNVNPFSSPVYTYGR
jgi:hypothetical protein